MDINGLAGLIERVGFPVVIAIVGAVLYWQSNKQSSSRDKSNATLLQGQINILAKLSEDVHASKIADIEAKGSIYSVKEQITDESNGINGKLDGIKSELVGINGKLDTQHTTVLGQFAGFLDRVTVINQKIADAKSAHEHRLDKIQTDFISIKSEMVSAIEKIIREERNNEIAKIPIVNVNHNGADG